MTNGDRIRNMNDEELAELLIEAANSCTNYCIYGRVDCENRGDCSSCSCSEGTLAWVKKESK